MKEVFDVIKRNPLWSGIGDNDFERMLHCVEAKTRSYGKGDIILLSGDKVEHIGLILSGSAKVIKEDMEGNSTILTELGASELFAEVFVCAGIGHSPVTVQASENCEVMFINYKKVITSCSSACFFHTRLIENMLMIRLSAKGTNAVMKRGRMLSHNWKYLLYLFWSVGTLQNPRR